MTVESAAGVGTAPEEPEAAAPRAMPAVPPRRRWRDWAQFLGFALIVLSLSEALWLWQTWPVRELLQAPASLPYSAGGR